MQTIKTILGVLKNRMILIYLNIIGLFITNYSKDLHVFWARYCRGG